MSLSYRVSTSRKHHAERLSPAPQRQRGDEWNLQHDDPWHLPLRHFGTEDITDEDANSPASTDQQEDDGDIDEFRPPRRRPPAIWRPIQSLRLTSYVCNITIFELDS